jgi:hypothetical protein
VFPLFLKSFTKRFVKNHGTCFGHGGQLDQMGGCRHVPLLFLFGFGFVVSLVVSCFKDSKTVTCICIVVLLVKDSKIKGKATDTARHLLIFSTIETLKARRTIYLQFGQIIRSNTLSSAT